MDRKEVQEVTYKLHWRRYNNEGHRSASTIITCDEVIVWATPAMLWSVGRDLCKVLDYLEDTRRLHHWELTGQEFRPRPGMIL
jgi:hypothetical protein